MRRIQAVVTKVDKGPALVAQTLGDAARRNGGLIGMQAVSGPLLGFPVYEHGLLGLLVWTVLLASVVTAAYYAAKGQLLRKSLTGISRDSGRSPDPSQVKVFGLFVLIAVLVFALLLATHFVPET